ncbi:MAG: HupE/UreJ family protein [Proteobacteria bacterium]|nr:HupE/UreJ family protein [Pseudomonadota bacterium]
MQTTSWRRIVAAAAVLAVSPIAAHAHVFGAEGAGWTEGLTHPFSGLDHVLAMVAVGLWAAQLGGRALWLVPGAFVAMLAVGGMIGAAGFAGMPVELGIVGSLLVLGMLVAAALRPRPAIGATIVGFLALFHGVAHGAEMPETAAPLLYGLGFVTATALLHGFGAGVGLYCMGSVGRWVVRAGGAGIAVAGLALLVIG